MGDPDARQNMLAAEAWLRCHRTYIWVYEAHSAAHFMQRAPLVKWPLGDVEGRCVGAAVWFPEGHLVRVWLKDGAAWTVWREHVGMLRGCEPPPAVGESRGR